MARAVKRTPIKKHKSHHGHHHKKRRVKPVFTYAIVFVLVLLVAAVGYLYLPIDNLMGDMIKEKGPVAATVNGEKIYASDVDMQYQQVPEMFRAGMSKDVILEQIISQEVLVQEAKEQNIKVSDKELNEFIDQAIAKSGWDEQKFEQVLMSQGMTLDKLKELYKVSLTIEKLLNNTVLSEIDVSEDEVKEYYENNIESFTLAEDMIHAKHILIRVSNDTHSDEDALEMISDLRTEIVEKGADFEEMALQYSEDPSAKDNKGDLGFFGIGDMVKEFEDAAYELEDVGEISQPVKTQFGYHLIELVDKKNAGDVQTFEDVETAIKKQLLSQRQREAVEEYISNLREEANIEYNEEYINKTSLPKESAPVVDEEQMNVEQTTQDSSEETDSETEVEEQNAEDAENVTAE